MQPFQFLTSSHQTQPLLQTQPVLVPHQGRLMPQIPTILTSQFEIESKWAVKDTNSADEIEHYFESFFPSYNNDCTWFMVIGGGGAILLLTLEQGAVLHNFCSKRNQTYVLRPFLLSNRGFSLREYNICIASWKIFEGHFVLNMV